MLQPDNESLLFFVIKVEKQNLRKQWLTPIKRKSTISIYYSHTCKKFSIQQHLDQGKTFVRV